MTVITKYIELSTLANSEIIDITDKLKDKLGEAGLKDGTVTVFVAGATGALSTIEYEPGLVQDSLEMWERIIPQGPTYHHDQAWGDGNGHSHLRATLMGPDLTIPFCDGELTLGQWQQVIFIDFDVRPRKRKLVLQFMGE
jgi:secondary thiamine-phosphate synthase enzyme